MAKDKIQLDATGLRILDATGRRVLADTGDDCDCACKPTDDCAFCPGATPLTYDVTIAGTTLLNGCLGCGGYSINGPGGNFDGTYVLTKAEGICQWIGSFSKTFTVYSSSDCSGTPTESGVTFTITLTKTNSTDWHFQIEGSVNGLWLFGSQSGEVTDTTGTDCETDLPVFANPNTIGCPVGIEGNKVGEGGTATISL